MRPQAGVISLSPEAPRVVLDTNAVLAWLWFEDPAVSALGSALQAGQIHWVASLAMRQELDLVVQRLPPRAALVEGPGGVLAAFDCLAAIRPTAPAMRGLACTDASDQMFIDLAVSEGARWLFSRDRAVLKLRRRAATHGVCIRPPQAWSVDHLNAG